MCVSIADVVPAPEHYVRTCWRPDWPVVATSREESLRSYRLFAARDPRVLLGLDPEWTWEQRDLIELMADKCGVSADPAHTSGHDVIDLERTLVALDSFAARLGTAAASASRYSSGPVTRTVCSVSTPPLRTPCRRRDVPSSPPRRVALST